jgi:hypothetical protein
MNKVLIIGMNPSTRGAKSPTLKVLGEWATKLEIIHYGFDNIYDKPGSFSLRDVRRQELLNRIQGHNRIVALGSKVSDILNLMGVEHFKLPHPSGLNRQMNNKPFVEEQLRLCKEYIYR